MIFDINAEVRVTSLSAPINLAGILAQGFVFAVQIMSIRKVISDPALPFNPIIYVFTKMT
jgi:hypothetical protein